MKKTQSIHCPNCGKSAQRTTFIDTGLIETSCPACDYLMVRSTTGNVVEAYAPNVTKP